MTTNRSTDLAAGAGAEDIPLLDGMITLGEDLMSAAGMPAWLRQLLWAAFAIITTFLLLRWLLRRGIPRLGRGAAEPAAVLVGIVGVLFLSAEFCVTRGLRLIRSGPPTIAYAYGDLVQSATTGAQDRARRILPALGGISALGSKKVVFLVVAVLFAVWNQSRCATVGCGECVRPVAAWQQSFSTWADTKEAENASAPNRTAKLVAKPAPADSSKPCPTTPTSSPPPK